MDLNKTLLKKLSLPQSYERGEDYFRNGKVEKLVKKGACYEASVRGSFLYHQRIDVRGAEWAGTCSCSYSYGGICKHLVAAGLAVIHEAFTKVEVDFVEIPDHQPFVVDIDQVREEEQMTPGSQVDKMDPLLKVRDTLSAFRILLGVYEGRSKDNSYAGLESAFRRYLTETTVSVADRKSCIELLFSRWDNYEASFNLTDRDAFRYDLASFQLLLISLVQDRITGHFTSMKLDLYGLDPNLFAEVRQHIARIE